MTKNNASLVFFGSGPVAAESLRLLAQDFDIEVLDWDKRETVLDGVDLLVNTTSLGMTGKPTLELNITSLKTNVLVCDIVYAPLMTDLLKQS